jgi:hypothetical protein
MAYASCVNPFRDLHETSPVTFDSLVIAEINALRGQHMITPAMPGGCMQSILPHEIHLYLLQSEVGAELGKARRAV